MKVSLARELKEELLHRASQMFREEATYEVRRARRGSLIEAVTRDVPRRVAAFGLAPRSRGFAVAVRIFEGYEVPASVLLADYERFGDELDIAKGIRYRPRITVRAGGSCGHYRITAGTLGGFVEDDDHYYMLSNNHVLADSDRATAGDPILQPGPADIQGRYRVIGRLHTWVPLQAAGVVDAAIARFDPGVKEFYPWDYPGIGGIQREPESDRYATRMVAKRGRTTGVTQGRVSAYELDGVVINYGTSARPKRVSFDDQIEFVGHPDPQQKPFSQPGDSGSLIIDSDSMHPYALLYGGARDSSGVDRTLGHFLPDVLRSLGVWLVQ